MQIILIGLLVEFRMRLLSASSDATTATARKIASSEGAAPTAQALSL